MSERSALVRLACLLAIAAGGSVGARRAQSTASVPDFEVEGTAFTACQCTAYACPCRSNAHPTHGSCESADFAYIKRGHFGHERLDGLKVVIIGNQFGAEGNPAWATAYFDQETTPAQRKAFIGLYKFMLSGSTEGVRYLNGFKVVPIDFRESSDKTEYVITIPGVLEMKGVMKRTKDGKPAITLPAMDQWGNKFHYVQNVVFRYNDKERAKSWNLSGRQANVKYFHTTKKMYENEELLFQHGDMSGTWTAKQRELIQKLGMKVE